MHIKALTILLVAGLPTFGQAQSDVVPPAPHKLAVLPFAALSGDVPQRAGTKAAGMLANELKNAEGVELVTPPKPAAAADPYGEGLARARNLVEEAKEQRQKRKFRLAEQSLQKALDEYRANAAGLTEVGELADTYALLSAVQFNTGRDEEGQLSLTRAVSFSPGRELPLSATSVLFGKVVLDTRKAVQLSSKGVLAVDSTPPGAAVLVDGVALGATPLEVKDVPAGLHVWRVQLPSGEVAGGTVEVPGAGKAKVSGQTSGQDPESRLLATLSLNRLDADAVTAVKEHAKALGVDLLLFGALSRAGKSMALDSFVYSTVTNEVKRLPRLAFDTELLSAGMEFYNLAGELARNGSKLGESTPVPGPVAAERVEVSTKVAEATFGVPAGKEDGLEPEGTAEPSPARTPLTPKSRKPLKK